MPRKSTVVRRLARDVHSGKSLRLSTASIISESLRARFTESDFQNMQRLKRRAYSSSYHSPTARWVNRKISQVQAARKKSYVKTWFSSTNPALGIFVIQPELFSRSKEVLRFLRENGIEVVLSRTTVLSKRQIHDVYGERHLSHEMFPVVAALLAAGPSKVVVFRHPTREGYYALSRWLRHLKKSSLVDHRRMMQKLKDYGLQGHFDQLMKGSNDKIEPGTLRTDITRKNLPASRFTRNRDAETEGLDPFRFFQNHPEKVPIMLAGIHSPKDNELAAHALSLLSQRELKWIDRRMRGLR